MGRELVVARLRGLSGRKQRNAEHDERDEKAASQSCAGSVRLIPPATLPIGASSFLKAFALGVYRVEPPTSLALQQRCLCQWRPDRIFSIRPGLQALADDGERSTGTHGEPTRNDASHKNNAKQGKRTLPDSRAPCSGPRRHGNQMQPPMSPMRCPLLSQQIEQRLAHRGRNARSRADITAMSSNAFRSSPATTWRMSFQSVG